MTQSTATAIAHPNIAFIKYWGDQDSKIHIPANGSISMVMDCLGTKTTVTFDPDYDFDQLVINHNSASQKSLLRVQRFLQVVRDLANRQLYARVVSENNFPMGAGIASSASAFAALSLAASSAIGLNLSESELSRLARNGSGSACRSIPSGFVEWAAGEDDITSYAYSIAPPDHWNLVDLVAIVNQDHKKVGSVEGHRLAATSPFQNTRVSGSRKRLDICRQALLAKDFEKFADIVEYDSNLMHAVMMTSHPPLFFWEPASLELIKQIPNWRKKGLPVCYTLDAGPNLHTLTFSQYAEEITGKIASIPGIINVLYAKPGYGARLSDTLTFC
jgi:diphosphomevalonate decarboxylase